MSEKTVSPSDIRFMARESAEKLWVIRRRCERYWADVRRYGRGLIEYGSSDSGDCFSEPEYDVDHLIDIIDELLILHHSREQRLADSEHKRRELERGRP